jgi:hypothetical protein
MSTVSTWSIFAQIKEKASDIFLEPAEVYDKAVNEAEAVHQKISSNQLNSRITKKKIRYHKSKTHPSHPQSLDFEVRPTISNLPKPCKFTLLKFEIYSAPTIPGGLPTQKID